MERSANQIAKSIRVLIADDHAVVREGLAAIIGRQPDLEVVAEAHDGRHAIELFLQLAPDLVLMDLHMPVIDGVEAIVEICKANRSARILALTTYDDDEYIYRAVQAGARGYLLKDVARDELLAAVRGAASGGRVIPQLIGEKLSRRMMQENLTPRELAVLICMADGESNEATACKLGITTGTVKCYVHKILSKLNVADRTAAVAKAFRQGLVGHRTG